MGPKSRKPNVPDPVAPSAIKGDEIFFNHGDAPCCGRVVAAGKHGVTVHHEGKHHRVPWQGVLGHKKRAQQKVKIIHEGEDGVLVEDDDGKRRFVKIPEEAREDKYMIKSEGGRRLLIFAKAGEIANRPGLHQEQKTDKTGRVQNRWVRTEQGHQAQPGHHVGFENGEHRGHGEVSAAGKDGVTVKDKSGGVHRVPHDKVSHHWDGKGAPDASPHEDQGSGKPEIKPHDGDPDSFNASQFSAQHDDPDASADSIIAGFGGDAKKRLDAARERLSGVTQTVDEHAPGGKWNEQRAALHRKLMFEGVEINGKKVPGILAKERIEAATPPKGEAPTFIALGGRGGSGKSSLNGRVYEESKAIVLDADHIKGMLPEYEGWNAHQVHEESSHVLETVMRMAKILRVNVVLDATMKTGKSIVDKVDDFKAAGFRTEAHYMHLPRQEAAKRAIGRYLNGGEKGRYVPPEVVLGNTKNEENFDTIKGKVDAWSFHDNSGEKGSGPKLIAQKGNPATVKKKLLIKSEQPIILLMSVVKRKAK